MQNKHFPSPPAQSHDAGRSMRGGLVIALVVAALLVIAAALAIMGRLGWPPLHNDADEYIPPAMNRAAGQGDNFAVYGRLFLQRSRGADDHPFNLHGQLYQALLGAVLSRPDFLELMRVMGSLNALSVVACAAYYFFTLRRRALPLTPDPSPPRGEGRYGPLTPDPSSPKGEGRLLSAPAAALWALLGALATASVLLELQGRPEHLIPLILAVCELIRLHLPHGRGWQMVSCGVTVGLVAATSPLPGTLLASAYLLGEAANPLENRWFSRCTLLVLAAAGTWFAVIALVCPYPPLQLIKNTISGADPAVYRVTDILRFHRVWLLNVHYPLLGFIYLLFVLSFGSRLYALRRLPLIQWFVALPALGVLGWGIIHGGLWFTLFLYNLTAFFPIVYLRVVEACYRWRAEAGMRLARRAPAVAAALCLATSYGFFHKLAQLPAYQAEGLSLQEARKLVRPYVHSLRADERIAIVFPRRPPFVVLDEPPDWRLLSIWIDQQKLSYDELTALEAKLHVHVKYLLYPQCNENVQLVGKNQLARIFKGDTPNEPPSSELLCFQLRENFFRSGQPRWMGFELGPSMPGYQFAVYERIPDCTME